MRHIPEKQLSTGLTEAAKVVIVGAQYRHYKQKIYVVLDLAILETTNEAGVIYQAQHGHNLTFMRPLTDWLEEVEWGNKRVKHFTKL